MSMVFGNAQAFGEDTEGYRAEYVPTLLHFSAMYGLRDLTAALLQCPGAVHAYGTANCEGDYPTNLAEKSGHWELRDFMHTYMEVAAMVHNDYGSRYNMEASQIMSSMVYGQYLSFEGDNHIPDDIYVPIGGGGLASLNLDLDTPPGYVPMHPAALSHSASLPQSVDYDFMIKRMLEPTPEEPEKEYEVLDTPVQMVLGERRQSTVLCEKVSEAPPPLPPPRDGNQQLKGSLDPDSVNDLLPNIHTNLSPAQEELISLQKKVKNNELTINQAVLRFKEWERKHKERAASFQFQQENLQRVRNSLMRSRDERKRRGEDPSIKISDPIVAGSSTYDKVLLKTRKEVMNKQSATHGSPKLPPKVPSFENAYHPEGGGLPGGFRSRTSFKNRSLDGPGNIMNRMGGGHFRSSLGSQGSSVSSRSSGRSISSIPDVPPPQPRRPGPKLSFNETSRFPYSSSPQLFPSHNPHQFHTVDGEAPPPPLPPRDDPYTMKKKGPAIPPRSPVLR